MDVLEEIAKIATIINYTREDIIAVRVDIGQNTVPSVCPGPTIFIDADLLWIHVIMSGICDKPKPVKVHFTTKKFSIGQLTVVIPHIKNLIADILSKIHANTSKICSLHINNALSDDEWLSSYRVGF
jgi:hypothetical protein